MNKSDAELPHKVHDALVGHDLDDVIIVLMSALGLAIAGNHNKLSDRLLQIEMVTTYLLEKAASDE